MSDWVSFRRDPNGIACLTWWRDQCNEWCYGRVGKDGKFAEQRYLDDWPARFECVVVSRLKGANLAPWNLANYFVENGEGDVNIDYDPLIFYHFHRLTRMFASVWFISLSSYDARLTKTVRERIYIPYIQSLLDAERALGLPISSMMSQFREHRDKGAMALVLGSLRQAKRTLKTCLDGNYIFLKDSLIREDPEIRVQLAIDTARIGTRDHVCRCDSSGRRKRTTIPARGWFSAGGDCQRATGIKGRLGWRYEGEIEANPVFGKGGGEFLQRWIEQSTGRKLALIQEKEYDPAGNFFSHFCGQHGQGRGTV